MSGVLKFVAAVPAPPRWNVVQFLDAWMGVGVGPDVPYEAVMVPYLNGSLVHPDGHSKILGFMFDVSLRAARPSLCIAFIRVAFKSCKSEALT